MTDETLTMLSDKLSKTGSIGFWSNDGWFTIELRNNGDYEINVYTSNEKDSNGCYLPQNFVDGGVYGGDCKDAIEFML